MSDLLLNEERHGVWALSIYDDQPIPEGHKYAPDVRVQLTREGLVCREFLYPAYRRWTLLAHWKDGLDPAAPMTDSPVTRPTATGLSAEAIARRATAHNYGQTVWDVTTDGDWTVLTMSSWPRLDEARRALEAAGYVTEERGANTLAARIVGEGVV